MRVAWIQKNSRVCGAASVSSECGNSASKQAGQKQAYGKLGSTHCACRWPGFKIQRYVEQQVPAVRLACRGEIRGRTAQQSAAKCGS
jgi:hypothetical protein